MCVSAVERQYNGEAKTECFDEPAANTKSSNPMQGTASEKSPPATSSASQIVWIPKIQSQQGANEQLVTLVTTSTTQPPPLYSRIKQMNYSQVDFSFIFSFFLVFIFQFFFLLCFSRCFPSLRLKITSFRFCIFKYRSILCVEFIMKLNLKEARSCNYILLVPNDHFRAQFG